MKFDFNWPYGLLELSGTYPGFLERGFRSISGGEFPLLIFPHFS